MDLNEKCGEQIEIMKMATHPHPGTRALFPLTFKCPEARSFTKDGADLDASNAYEPKDWRLKRK